ncbi:MAG: hypothetical protein M1115_05350 [Actinobacteria bacterium]|nr:hypothetical protein [Actinomycetota bacterium]
MAALIAVMVGFLVNGVVNQGERASLGYQRSMNSSFAALAWPLALSSNKSAAMLKAVLENMGTMDRLQLGDDLARLDQSSAMVAVRAEALSGAPSGRLRRSPGKAVLPVSSWVGNAGRWSPGGLSALVSTVRSAPGLTPAPRVTILLAWVDPPPVPGSGNEVTLLPTGRLVVHMVVADTGNVGEHAIPLEVRLERVPSGPGTTGLGGSATLEKSVTLLAGQRQSVVFPAMSVTTGDSYILEVKAGPAPGQVLGPGTEDSFNLHVGS